MIPNSSLQSQSSSASNLSSTKLDSADKPVDEAILPELDTSSNTSELQAEENFSYSSHNSAKAHNPTARVLLPHHLQEWQHSGVSDEIIKRNIYSIVGRDAVVTQLNLGSYPAWSLEKLEKTLFKGGWVCGQRMKPDTPRVIPGKLHKYEAPKGSSCAPIKLDLPEEIWQKIATKYGAAKPPEMDGWKWVQQNPKIDVAIAEGEKKAGCIITQTLTPCLALPGHTAAFKRDGGDVRFKEFLHPDRKIIICFDKDRLENAAASVARTVKGIGWRLNPKKKKPLAELFICRWWTTEKGIDDLWANQGQAAVEDVITNAIPWKRWVDTSYNLLGFEPDTQFCSPKWQPTEIPKNHHLVGIIGQKGTGKTWQLEQLCLEAKDNDRPLIAITHRIQLSQSLANRLGLVYIDDLDSGVTEAKNIALCVDSLAKVDPQKFAGGIIIIDEARQVLEHFLIGETCAYKREKILKAFREIAKVILETDGQFVVADADLNGSTLKWFSGLLGEAVPYIVQNTYRETSYRCHLSNGALVQAGENFIKTPSDVVSVLITEALKGKRIFVFLTGQKEDSRWGSINVEGLLLKMGVSSVIRIDSETTKNPDHKAFCATGKINELCDTHQVVIGTPTLGTGVSIENKKPFDLVIGIFTGVGSPDAARQALMRVRDKSVPRLIYVADRGLDRTFSNLGYTKEKVGARQKELQDFQEISLKNHDAEVLEEYPQVKHCNLASTFFDSLIATRNNENVVFKNYVRWGLEEENVQVIDVKVASEIYETEYDVQEIYDAMGEIKEENVTEYRAKLEVQERLEKEEYDKLKGASTQTESERIALEATVLSNRYGGVKVTQELIKKDADGWFDLIKLHYACTVGQEIQKDIQALKANSQMKRGEGTVIQHDFVERQKLLVKADFILNSRLIDLINSQHTFSSVDNKTVELFEYLVNHIANINLIFNTKLKPQQYKLENFNFRLIETVAQLIGATGECLGQPSIQGKRVRQYQIKFVEDGRENIFDAWLKRDLEIQAKWFERKREWETKKLIMRIDDEISVEELLKLQKHTLFNDAWEKIHTPTRTNIINRVDNFAVPEPQKIFVDASDNQAVEAAFKIINQWQMIAADSETYGNDTPNKKGIRKEGLHKFKAQLRLLQISNDDTVYTFDFGGRNSTLRETALMNVKPHFNKILGDKTKTVIGHNLNFDAAIWRKTFDSNFECKFVDTLLGLQIFYGIYNGKNLWSDGGYGLGNAVQKLLGIPMDKSEQKSDWGQDLTKYQIDYAALDPQRTYWVAMRMMEMYSNPSKFGFNKLSSINMTKAWELECALIAPLADMEHEGLPISLNKLKQMRRLVNGRLRKVLKLWDELNTGIKRPTMVAKLVPHLNEKYGLSLTRSKKQDLSEYKDLPEVKLRFAHSGLVQMLCRIETLIKSAEQYGDRIKTFYSPLSGTGRTSSGGGFKDIINIQSIPAKVDTYLQELKIPSIRTAFTVPLGFNYIVGDLAAAHARFAIDYSRDKLGLIAMNNDADVHSLYTIKTAQCFPDKFIEKGIPERFLAQEVTIHDDEILNDFKKQSKKPGSVEKQGRDVSKNIFYGKLNLASWKRLQIEVKGQLKILLTDAEAQSASNLFSEMYPNLTQYCKDIVKKLENAENQIWIDGKLFGIHWIEQTGQRLLFDLKYDGEQVNIPATNVVASTWARTEATCVKKALILCHKIFKKHPEWEAKLINVVHDELNATCREEYKIKVAKVVAWTMAREFQKELKNGVKHGCTNFKDNDEKSSNGIHSIIVKSWADK